MPKREYAIRASAPSKFSLRDLRHCTRIVRTGDTVDPDSAAVIPVFGSIFGLMPIANSSYNSLQGLLPDPAGKLECACQRPPGGVPFPAQTVVERQTRSNFPGVLREQVELRLADVHGVA
jgi:hypothetical protein